MATVLVIEDDADIRVIVAKTLQHGGHAVIVAANGRTGLEFATRSRPDLIIIDMILPDVPGEHVIRGLTGNAATQDIPVLILSGRVDEADRVRGLELGVEDYITKPFSPRELCLRVEIVLRRSTAPRPNGQVECNGLRIDSNAHRAFLDHQELSLTPTEFRLLAALAGTPDRVLSRQSLLADVWGMQPNLETRTVDTHIKRLREKLGHAADLIETVRGIGYRFQKRQLREVGPKPLEAVG